MSEINENTTPVRPDMTSATPEELARYMAQLLWKKQGIDIELYRTADRTIIADYFLLATGRSSTHVKALADDIAYEMSLSGVRAARTEGHDGAAWILIDFCSVIVHVFDRESREYYRLERLLGEENKLPLTFAEEG